MRVFFVFSLNTRNSGHLYTRLWTHEQDIPQKPWREEKINHLKQLLKFRKTSVKAENITCVPAPQPALPLWEVLGLGDLPVPQGGDVPGAGTRDMVTSSLPQGLLLPFNPALLAGAKVFSRRDFLRSESSCLSS